VLIDDLAFQRTHFRTTPTNIPRLYQHDMATDDNDELPLQNRSTIQNIELLTNACPKETSQAIIDSSSSCCVTPYIDDFIHQPTPIQNTTLKGISGGLTALGRGTLQLKINLKKQRKHNIDNIQRDIRTILPYSTNQPATITQTIQSKRTLELMLHNRRKHSNTISQGGYVHMRLPPKIKRYQH
jgi:hypothetical protein